MGNTCQNVCLDSLMTTGGESARGTDKKKQERTPGETKKLTRTCATLCSQKTRVRLGGSGQINWKSVASEDAPVKATRTGLRRPKTAGRERSLGKMRGVISKRGNKKKESSTAKSNWAKAHNGKVHTRRGGDARQASQVHGWQTRSFGAAILILGRPLRAASGSRPRENAVVP